MFSPEIYGSWHTLQKRKYAKICTIVGNAFLHEAMDGKRVLDVGCGHGLFEAFLKDRGFTPHVIGVDKSAAMLQRGVLADGDDLPFRDGCFDAVMCIDSIHLLKDNDFCRTLKNGGIVLISIFFSNDDYSLKRQYTRNKIRGFDILMEFTINDSENEYVVIARKR